MRSRGLAAILAGSLPLLAGAGRATETVPLRGLRAEVAALLMQGVAGGGLPIAAAVFRRPPDAAGDADLGVLIELEAASPAEAAAGRPLEIYAYAIDDAGEVAAHFAVTLADWSDSGDGIKISGRLRAPPGELSVRFLVWDPALRRYGMAVQQIGPGIAGSAPRIDEECTDWSLAGSEATDLHALSARPVLVVGERRRLSLDRPPPASGWRLHWIRGSLGTAARAVEAATVTPSGEVDFAVPDLPPGIYRLSVAAAGDETWRSASIEVWLVSTLPPTDGGCPRSWGRVLRLARAGPQVARVEPSQVAGKRPLLGLPGEYEALLGRLASAGDLRSAAAELAALEMALVADDLDLFGPLSAAELKAARELAEREPGCLLPLIALHTEAYRVHHRAGRFPLATHSRRLAASIADLAVDLLPAEERGLIAVAITGLADIVETRRASVEAQRLLERALALDDQQEAARLLLAVSYERKGRYADARRELEALVSANSAHHEARVRLAILLRRTGDPEEAERLLRAVVAEQPPAWLLSLGYQTLAQLLIRDARSGEAVTWLEEARGRLPDEQALQVLLAYALDRGGRRREMQRVLAGLPMGRAAVSARYRYSDEPAAELGLLRETLRQSITVRLPLLARAVGADGAGGPEG